ncbi:rod shape-determining protein MreC, partial [Candidatus Berkelbacteria bacterium]|nr:rod shape-determining protein MreC [Candidatus Berkelbacteria bacterium]
IITALLLLPVTPARALRSFGARLMRPITQPLIRVYQSSSAFIAGVIHIKDVVRQLNALEVQNLKLQSVLGELTEVKVQNEALRKELAAKATMLDQEIVSAQVIGRSPIESIAEIMIDRGSRDGVKTNQPVLVTGNLLGIVHEVAETTATVRLISAYNSAVPVVLQSSRAIGLLKGGLRGLVVDDLPADAQINPGEQVVTERLGVFTHQGIAVGQVSKIISGKSEIFQIVSVNSPIELSNADYVTVVIQ